MHIYMWLCFMISFYASKESLSFNHMGSFLVLYQKIKKVFYYILYQMQLTDMITANQYMPVCVNFWFA